MKKILFTILILFISSGQLFSQNTFKDKCEALKILDEIIYTLDTQPGADVTLLRKKFDAMHIVIEEFKDYKEIDSVIVEYKRFKIESTKIIDIVRNQLYPILKIKSENLNLEQLKYDLNCIIHAETITWIEYGLQILIDEYKSEEITNRYNTFEGLFESREIVRKRVNELIESDFTFYSFTNSSNKWVKGIYIDHSNDFFSIYNDDRDYTGGFRVELFTDQLKLRLFSSYSDHIANFNGRNWYSYQSFMIGGEGYTPYLRDTTIFNDDYSIDSLDRPYGSFSYFGRTKHRITRGGRFRSQAQLKLGKIGSQKPGFLQAVIHRDITIYSQTPHGWKAQIASGGRIAFNYELVGEYLLNYKSTRNWDKFSLIGMGSVGHDKTYLGGGFCYSSQNLKKRGGIEMSISEHKSRSFTDFMRKNVTFTTCIKYRHMFHDSMLEGYGIFKQAKDEDPNSPVDMYVLEKNQVIRNHFIFEVNLNFRLRYVGLFLKQTISSPEYNLPVNSIEYSNGDVNGSGVGNHNRNAWNHVGTLGLSFLIK